MVDQPLRIFTGIKRQTFERMKEDLRALGVDVPGGDRCLIEHLGSRGLLAFSEDRERVEVRILRTPIFISQRAAWRLVDRVMRRYTTVPGSRNEDG